jgi:chromosomal replication initiation ATPase DnaA
MTPRVHRYAYEAAQELGVEQAAVMGRSRLPVLCQARWRVMKRLRADGFTVKQIGRWLDRDHTTVLYGLKAVAK